MARVSFRFFRFYVSRRRFPLPPAPDGARRARSDPRGGGWVGWTPPPEGSGGTKKEGRGMFLGGLLAGWIFFVGPLFFGLPGLRHPLGGSPPRGVLKRSLAGTFFPFTHLESIAACFPFRGLSLVSSARRLLRGTHSFEYFLFLVMEGRCRPPSPMYPAVVSARQSNPQPKPKWVGNI